MLWEFAVALADSAMGRRDVCFSFSELLIKLMGKKKLLWRSGKSFVCQEGSLNLQILSCIISEIQVWLKDNEVVLHTTWETFIQLLQQFPDTITAAEEWIRQKVRVVGVLTLPH